MRPVPLYGGTALDSRFVTMQRNQLALQIVVVLVLGGGRFRFRR